MTNNLPVIFLAFANEQHEGRYLSKVVEEYKQLYAILKGVVEPEKLFDDEEVLALFHEAIARRKENPRARPDMKTMAFHLLTLPEIEE